MDSASWTNRGDSPENRLLTCASYHDAGLTIIFAGCGFDHRAGFRRRLATETNDEPLDTLIATGEAAAIHQVLPDAFGVAALREFPLDGFPVWLAGTTAGGCFGWGRRLGRQYRARVGG